MIRSLIKKWRNNKQIEQLKRRRDSWRDYRDHCMKQSSRAYDNGDFELQKTCNRHALGAVEAIQDLNAQLQELS